MIAQLLNTQRKRLPLERQGKKSKALDIRIMLLFGGTVVPRLCNGCTTTKRKTADS